MDPQADPAALYKKADRLLFKWRTYWDKEALNDARQELVLAALEGKDMRAKLQTFMEREIEATSHILPAPRKN